MDAVDVVGVDIPTLDVVDGPGDTSMSAGASLDTESES